MNFEGRKFKLWFYQVSHSEMLLRSLSNDKYKKNVDIYLGGVNYVEIPTILDELEIKETERKDEVYINEKLGRNTSGKNIFVLVSKNKRYYIVASVMKVIENDLDIFELPCSVFFH